MFANVGSVVEFTYKNDEKPRLAKVIAVRDTDVDRIQPARKFFHVIRRSRYLLTCIMPGGSIRSFYTDSMQPGARVLSLWERFKLWISGVSFK